jgi:hypothetical protein
VTEKFSSVRKKTYIQRERERERERETELMGLELLQLLKLLPQQLHLLKLQG